MAPPSGPSRQDGYRTGRPSNGQTNLQRTDKDGQLEAGLQVSSLHSIVDRSRAELERLEAENERLHVQQQHDLRSLRLADQVSHETIIALTRQIEVLVCEAQKFKSRLAEADSQRQVAKHEVHESKSQVESLKNDLQHIHTWAVRAQNEQRHLEQMKERVKDLENRNAWLLKNAEPGARDFYQEWTQVVEKEAQVKHLLKEWEKEREKERKSIIKEEHAKMRRLEEDFARKLREKDAILEQTRTEMSQEKEMAEKANLTIASLRKELAESTQEVQALRTSWDGAEAKIAELMAAREEHGQILGTGATPRVILALKLMQSNPHPTMLEQGDLAMMQFTQSCSTNLLTPKLLDVSLSMEQALKLARHVADDASLKDSISFVVCVVCKMPKIMSSSRVCEFPSSNGGHMSCCQRAVCTSCLCDSIVKSLTSGWWHNLDSSQWLTCPTPGCDKIVPLRHADELPRLLRSGGLKQMEIDDLLSESKRATAFREALAGLAPAPTEEALRIAAKLHARLVATGKMKSLFDPSFENTEPDDDGRVPEFRPGRIKMLGVDIDDVSTQGQATTVQVPVFTRFFNRKSVECVVCGEMLLDIDYGQNAQEWKDHCTGFPGPWMWDVLLFPAGLVMGCEPYHAPDTCKECLRTHLRVQLEQFGRDHCDRLSCPSVDCGRSLNYAEVKTFADNETFEKYDRYQLLNNLSAEPNFRWCLRKGCDNGELYEEADDPHIICSACNFEMCFKHQMPWHQGVTCQQYDSEQSEDFVNSARWIENNSKMCPGPGCGVNIVKGEACFHMTCTRCNFEFCWVCLADWNLICTSNGYQRNAHNPGCWFRDSEVQPTQLFGEEVEAAAARRRGEPPGG